MNSQPGCKPVLQSKNPSTTERDEQSDRRSHDRGAPQPGTARALFDLASYGRRDPAAQETLRTMFAKEQILPEFLLDYESQEPFACLELNNGLSDNF